MKVAIISRGKPSPEYPLYGIFEFDQAKALAKKGIEVAFIVIDFRARSFKRKYGLIKHECEGVHVFELSLPINVYRKAIPVLQQLLLIPFRSMLKSFGKPDIIHAHFYSIAAIACILKKKYGIPFVITEHSSKLNKTASQISDLDKRLATKAYQNCDQLICVSEALRNNILLNFGHDSIVISNMVDNQCFSYHPHERNFSPFTYVSVGNLIPLKGFDKLVKAFATLNDDARLIIIGDGTEKQPLQTLIDQMGLSDRITLMGQLERKRIGEVFQTCHAFTLASSSETFGVSCIEALYSGLPVIVTRCGGPESFMNEHFGMLVPIDDIQALAKAMTHVRNNYASYDPFLISSESMKRFSPEIVAEDIIKAYKSCLTH